MPPEIIVLALHFGVSSQAAQYPRMPL